MPGSVLEPDASEQPGGDDQEPPYETSQEIYDWDSLKWELYESELDYIPAVRVSTALEPHNTVVAEAGINWNDEEGFYVYLYADRTVYDILISAVYKLPVGERVHSEDHQPPEFIELCGFLYVPELSAGQAVMLIDPYPYADPYAYADAYVDAGSRSKGSEIDNYTRIAYTNSDGKYEAVIILGDKGKETPGLAPTHPYILDRRYDPDFYISESSYWDFPAMPPNPFTEKMQTGAYDDYLPQGFCISSGSLGDINGDGIEDAVICLSTEGCRVGVLGYVMRTPLFLLVGQPGGEYVIEQKIPGDMFTPYRSSACPIAGTGYIDIVYDIEDGATHDYLETYRFCYDESRNDWLLKEFSDVPKYADGNSEAITTPALVRALPEFMGLPLSKFDRNSFYDGYTNHDYFDAVGILTLPSGASWYRYSEIYTIAVIVERATGYYEGYIYNNINIDSYDDDVGYLMQTIRGDYRSDSSLAVTVSETGGSFAIQGDTWVLNGHVGRFYLARDKE